MAIKTLLYMLQC